MTRTMNRRNALKLLGVIVACFTGRYVMADEGLIFQDPIKLEPMNIQINEATTENIIILCKDGSKLTIPFSDIIEALKPTTEDYGPPEFNGGYITWDGVSMGLRSDGTVIWKRKE